LARSIALDQTSDLESLMVVERTLGAVLAFSGEPEEGAAICEQAIARARRTDLWLTSALTNLAIATFEINPDRAAEASLEAIEESKRIGSKYYQGSAWAGLSLARMTTGDTAGSCQAGAEALLMMLDSGARQNVLLSLLRMSDSLVDVATEAAVALSAGAAALQIGPGSDGTWRDRRYRHIRSQVNEQMDDATFDLVWNRGLTMSVDDMVVVAREAVDAAWPQLVT
jgi:hypothetical protein